MENSPIRLWKNWLSKYWTHEQCKNLIRSPRPLHVGTGSSSRLSRSGWWVLGRNIGFCKTRLPAAGAGTAHTLLLQTARKPSSVPNKLMNYSPPPSRFSAGARSRNRALAASESLRAGALTVCRVSRGGCWAALCLQVSQTSLKINSSCPGPSTGPSVDTRRCRFPPHTRLFGRERLIGIKEFLPLGLNRVSPGPEQAEEPKPSFAEEPGGAKLQNQLKFNGSGALVLSGAVEHQPLS